MGLTISAGANVSGRAWEGRSRPGGANGQGRGSGSCGAPWGRIFGVPAHGRRRRYAAAAGGCHSEFDGAGYTLFRHLTLWRCYDVIPALWWLCSYNFFRFLPLSALTLSDSGVH